MSGRTKQLAMVRASYKELVSFVRYYNHSGAQVIIEGWAVYFYNPYYGSVDIDVVEPNLDGSSYEIKNQIRNLPKWKNFTKLVANLKENRKA